MSNKVVSKLPLRPDFGKKGRNIKLKSNFYPVTIPDCNIHHYDVNIEPTTCPPRLNREIIKTLVDKHLKDFFNNKRPAFDGRKNLFCINELNIGRQKYDFEVVIKGIEGERERKFKVSIKWAAQVNLHELQLALRGEAAIPSNAIQALDVVLRQLPSTRCIPVGRSFFSAPALNSNISLGGGREIWFGHHQSIRPSQWKMLINIDVSATAFYKAQPVIDFLAEITDFRHCNQMQSMSDADRIKLSKEIKGLKVEVNHLGKHKRKYRVANVTKLPANKLKFPFESEGKEIDVTVAWYFNHKYDIQLKYPNLPCLHLGQETRHIYLPMELCNLIGGQRCIKKLSDNQTSVMIKATAKEAPARQREITKIAQKAGFNNDVYLKTFGISVGNQMAELNGRVIDPPRIEYLGPGNNQPGKDLQPREGKWDMRGKHFIKGIAIDRWGILVFGKPGQCREEDLKKFANVLSDISRKMGMHVNREVSYCSYLRIDELPKHFKKMSQLKQKLQLAVVVLPGKTPAYAQVKSLGDREFCLPTQCIQMKNLRACSPQTIANLCLKINGKVNGTNWKIVKNDRPPILNRPVLFLGADVTHPAPGDDKKPSIAAVVGSLDSIPSKYQAEVCIQGHRQEIIADLQEMVKTLLEAFYCATQRKPQNIIMFRDGVSEGQFQQVLQCELHAIQQACRSLNKDYQPAITFIVVQKRHHARFFAADNNDQVGRSKNIPAGTTVDTVVCHPYEFDYYLCSHAGIQGTSRPAHYHVLYDDHDFKADELHHLSYHLCHTYIRCTRSVSIPAPAYYAHLVAFRARHHLDRELDSHHQTTSGDIDKELLKKMTKAVSLPEEMRRSMYFV